MSRVEREFIFELKEIVKTEVTYSLDMPPWRKDVVAITTGHAIIRENGEIDILVDDDIQLHGFFESKDTLFNKMIKKIHEFTKGRQS